MARVTQAHIDARRDEILDAARGLFLRHGFRNVTMQDIASEAGLSAGAIYRYYPGKDELVRAYLEHCAGAGPAQKINEVAADKPPLERLLAITAMVRQMWVETKGELIVADMQTAIAGLRQPDEYGQLVHCAREQLYASIIDIVEQGQRAGEIDPRLDARATTVSLYAYVMGIGLVALSAGEEQLEEQLDMMFGVFNDVLKRLGPAGDGGANLLDEE